MKLARPKLTDDLEESTIEQMVDDGELESARIVGEIARNCNVVDLRLIDVSIEEVQMPGSQFSRILARDTVIRRTDLSSASLDNGMLVRVEFINCRMTSIDFSHTAIHDVTFLDCQLEGAVFVKADLRRVNFVGCALGGVDFSTAHCIEVDG